MRGNCSYTHNEAKIIVPFLSAAPLPSGTTTPHHSSRVDLKCNETEGEDNSGPISQYYGLTEMLQASIGLHAVGTQLQQGPSVLPKGNSAPRSSLFKMAT